MTVTGRGGRTSKNTGYDRVEFRALAENGVDKQGYDRRVAGGNFTPRLSQIRT
jgi:hypothetical protein